MKGQLPLIVVLLLVTAGLTGACGGNGAAGKGATPGKAESPAPTAEGAEGTPTSFEALRDALRDRLDAIGVNIGAVPDDVRDQILASCRELAAFVEGERVEEVCRAIGDAIEGGDPGLIDLVLDRLAELEGD